MTCDFSIVSPVYLSAELVPLLVDRVMAAARGVSENFELILVDDGSPDEAWGRILAACATDCRIRGVRLTRNFGQQNAITAGLIHARGQRVIVMDADLQDDPSYIPALLARAEAGYEVVLTRKKTREYGALRNGITLFYYKIFNTLADVPAGDGHIGGFSLISRRVVDAYLKLPDYQRDYLLLVRWMGFRTSVLEVTHAVRPAGRSSYTPLRLARYALQSLTSHSTALLRLAVAIGFAYVVVAAMGIVYLVVGHFNQSYRPGWASTVVLILGSTGTILMAIGVLGVYLGNIFDQVRGRPWFLVGETANLEPSAPAPRAPGN